VQNASGSPGERAPAATLAKVHVGARPLVSLHPLIARTYRVQAEFTIVNRAIEADLLFKS
jgi:hypothetical protein